MSRLLLAPSSASFSFAISPPCSFPFRASSSNAFSALHGYLPPKLLPIIRLWTFSSMKSNSLIGDRPWRFRRSGSHVLRAVLDPDAGAILHDTGATVLLLFGAYVLVFVFKTLTDQNIIDQSLSRKLVHMLSGILFMASWPIFSTSSGARYFASFVPLVNCFRLVINGLSLHPDVGLIKSVTREGNPMELLRGPLYYVLILIGCSLCFWRDSPVGLISLAMMCGGDGVADIIGKRYGTLKIPYNQRKSFVGSFSMFACGFTISMGMLYYFWVLGYLQLDWGYAMGRVAIVSLVATIVESLPINHVLDDNISVPLASMAMAAFIFR